MDREPNYINYVAIFISAFALAASLIGLYFSYFEVDHHLQVSFTNHSFEVLNADTNNDKFDVRFVMVNRGNQSEVILGGLFGFQKTEFFIECGMNKNKLDNVHGRTIIEDMHIIEPGKVEEANFDAKLIDLEDGFYLAGGFFYYLDPDGLRGMNSYIFASIEVRNEKLVRAKYEDVTYNLFSNSQKAIGNNHEDCKGSSSLKYLGSE